jgi:hypothetical protein
LIGKNDLLLLNVLKHDKHDHITSKVTDTLDSARGSSKDALAMALNGKHPLKAQNIRQKKIHEARKTEISSDWVDLLYYCALTQEHSLTIKYTSQALIQYLVKPSFT